MPLVLMLRAAKPGEEEYAVIKADGRDDKRLALNAIATTVREWTDVLAGDGKDVVNKELELTVYRHDQDDLTLIDLPGLTRVPLKAKGQHDDIENTITKMYMHYMKPEEAVLLNVATCMVDFTNSTSLKLSQELDPKGTRTLLCATKVDQRSRSLGENPQGRGRLSLPCVLCAQPQPARKRRADAIARGSQQGACVFR
eukprot:m.113759 g.113759  ORF g.113759 m.113759 type:complete len:198 (-) comp16260_c0_seq4:413-1006(-)